MDVLQTVQKTNRKRKSQKRLTSLLDSRAKVVWSPVKVNQKELKSLMQTYSYRQMQKMAKNMGLEANLSKKMLATTILLRKNVFFPEEVGRYTHGSLIHMIRYLKVVNTLSAQDADNLTKSQAQKLLMDAWNGGTSDNILLKMQQVIELHDIMHGLEDKFCSSKVKKYFRKSNGDEPSFYEQVESLMSQVLQLYEDWMKSTSLLQKRKVNKKADKILLAARRSVVHYIETIKKECKSKVYYTCDPVNMPDIVQKWMKVSDVENKLVMCNVTVQGKIVDFHEGDYLVPGMKIYVAVKSFNEEGEPVVWLGVGKPPVEFVYAPDLPDDNKEQKTQEFEEEYPAEEALHNIPYLYPRPEFNPPPSGIKIPQRAATSVSEATPAREATKVSEATQTSLEVKAETKSSTFLKDAASLVKDAILIGGKFAVSKTLEALFYSIYTDNTFGQTNTDSTSGLESTPTEVPIKSDVVQTPQPQPTIVPSPTPPSDTSISIPAMSRTKTKIRQDIRVAEKSVKALKRTAVNEERELQRLRPETKFEKENQRQETFQKNYNVQKAEEKVYRLKRKLQLSKLSEKEQIRRLQQLLQSAQRAVNDNEETNVKNVEEDLNEARDLLDLRGRKLIADDEDESEKNLIDTAEDEEEMLIRNNDYGRSSIAVKILTREQKSKPTTERQEISRRRINLLIRVNEIVGQNSPNRNDLNEAKENLIESRNLRWQQDAYLLQQLDNLMRSEYELKYVDNQNTLTPAPPGIPTYIITPTSPRTPSKDIINITVKRDYNKPVGWLLQPNLPNSNNQYNQPNNYLIQNTPPFLGNASGLNKQTVDEFALVPFVHINSWLSPAVVSDTQAGKPVTSFMNPSPSLLSFTKLLQSPWPRIPNGDKNPAFKTLVSHVKYLNTMSDYLSNVSMDGFTPYYFNMGPVKRNVKQLQLIRRRIAEPWTTFLNDMSEWVNQFESDTYQPYPVVNYAPGNLFPSPQLVLNGDRNNLQIPEVALMPLSTLNVLWNHYFLTLQQLGQVSSALQKTGGQIQDTITYLLQFSNGLSLSVDENIFVSDPLVNVRMLLMHLMTMVKNQNLPTTTRNQVSEMLGDLFVRIIGFFQKQSYRDMSIDTVEVVMDTQTHQEILKAYTPIIDEMKWLSQQLPNVNRRLKNSLALIVVEHDNMQPLTPTDTKQQPVKPTYLVDPRSLNIGLNNVLNNVENTVSQKINKVLQIVKPLGKDLAKRFQFRNQGFQSVGLISVFVSPLDFVWDFSRVPDKDVAKSFSNIYQISHDETDIDLSYALSQFRAMGNVIDKSQAITSFQGVVKPLRGYQDRQLVAWDPILLPEFDNAVRILEQYPDYEGFLQRYQNTVTFIRSWISSHTHFYSPYDQYTKDLNEVEQVHVPAVNVSATFGQVYQPIINLKASDSKGLMKVNNRLQYLNAWQFQNQDLSAWLWVLQNFIRQVPSNVNNLNNLNQQQNFQMFDWQDFTNHADTFLNQFQTSTPSRALREYYDLSRRYFNTLTQSFDTSTIAVNNVESSTMLIIAKPSFMVNFYKKLPDLKESDFNSLDANLQTQVNNLYVFSNNLNPQMLDESEPSLPLVVPDLNHLQRDFQSAQVPYALSLQKFLFNFVQSQQGSSSQVVNYNGLFNQLTRYLPAIPTTTVAPVNVQTSEVVTDMGDYGIEVGGVYHGVRSTTSQVQDWTNYKPDVTIDIASTMIEPITIRFNRNANGFAQSLPYSEDGLSLNNNVEPVTTSVAVNSVLDVQPRVNVLKKLIKLDADRKVNASIRPVGARSVLRQTYVDNFTFSDSLMSEIMLKVLRDLAIEQKVKLLNTRETIAEYAKTTSESVLSASSPLMSYWNVFEQSQSFTLTIKLMFYTNILQHYRWVYDNNVGTWKLVLTNSASVSNVETVVSDSPVVSFTLPTDNESGQDIYTALTRDNYYPQEESFAIVSFTEDGHTVTDHVIRGSHQIPVSFFTLWNGVQQFSPNFQRQQQRAVVDTVGNALNLIEHDSSSFVDGDIIQTILNTVSSCAYQVGMQAENAIDSMFQQLRPYQVSLNNVRNSVTNVYAQGIDRDIIANELFQTPFTLNPASRLFTELSKANNDNTLLDVFTTVQRLSNGSELALAALRDFVFANFAEATEMFDSYFSGVLQTNVNRSFAFVQITRFLANLLRFQSNQLSTFYTDQAIVNAMNVSGSVELSVQRNAFIFGQPLSTSMAENSARTVEILQNILTKSLDTFFDVSVSAYFMHTNALSQSNVIISSESLFVIMNMFFATFIQTVKTPPLQNPRSATQIRRWNEMVTTLSFSRQPIPLLDNLYRDSTVNTNLVVGFNNLLRQTMVNQNILDVLLPLKNRARQIFTIMQREESLQGRVALAANDLSNVFRTAGCPHLSFVFRPKPPTVMYEDDTSWLMQSLLGETTLLLDNSQLFRVEVKKTIDGPVTTSRQVINPARQLLIAQLRAEEERKFRFYNNLYHLNEERHFAQESLSKKALFFRQVAGFFSNIFRRNPLTLYMKGHIVGPATNKLLQHPVINAITNFAKENFPLEYEFVTWLGKEYISFTIANVLLPILPYSNVVLQNPEIFKQTPIAGIIRKFSLKETFAMLGPNTNGVKEETFSQYMLNPNGNVYDYIQQEFQLNIDKHLVSSSSSKVQALTNFLQDLIYNNFLNSAQIPEPKALKEFTGTLYSTQDLSNIYNNLRFTTYGSSTVNENLRQSIKVASATFHQNQVMSQSVKNQKIKILLSGFQQNF